MSQSDGELFMALLALQDNTNFMTKGQLLARMDARGWQVSDRQLTTWITAGVVPKSARMGGDNLGVVPAIAVDLACFVAACRRVPLDFAEIRELLPLWRHLKQVTLHPPHELDLTVFGDLVRDLTLRTVCVLPWLASAMLAGGQAQELAVRDVEGQLRHLDQAGPLVVSFTRWTAEACPSAVALVEAS